MPVETHCPCELCQTARGGVRPTRNSDESEIVYARLVDVLQRYSPWATVGTTEYVNEALLRGDVTMMRRAIERLESDYTDFSVYDSGHVYVSDSGYDDSGYDVDDVDYDDADDTTAESDLIHYHDYRPRPVFYGDGPLFMGFELETAVSGYGRLNRAAELVQKRIGDHGYLKEDGSISYGFEIVTHPMSYDYAINHFPWELMRDMRENRIGPDGTTGLHVHVSRAAFRNPAHIYKWMKFIYRNQTAVESVARRRASGWAKFERAQRRDIIHYAKDKNGTYYGDRYSAINVQNRDTFEVRIFDSTDKRRELQAALGLVDASVRYAADIDSAAILNAKAWDFPAFVDWAYTAERKGKSKASYSSLLTEIDRLELV